jgi:hypothetical protein
MRRSPPVPAPCSNRSMRLRTMSTSPSPAATCNGDHLSLTRDFAYVLCPEMILMNLLEGRKVTPEDDEEIKWAASSLHSGR